VSPDQLARAFGIGLLATLSPCALPLYPGFLAYLAARSADRVAHGSRVDSGTLREDGWSRWLGLFVLAGVLTMMLSLGALIAALSVAVGNVLVVVTPLADLVVIGLGVALLLGMSPFAKLPTVQVGAGGGGPILSAYVYGLLYGPIALPCSATFVVAIFTLSLSVASFVEKLVFFLVFGLGFGVPLLVISLLAEARRAALLRAFTRNYGVVARIAGAILVVVGVWDLWNNLPFLLLYLGL
jgi:cytochrome c-type biogenesis protein